MVFMISKKVYELPLYYKRKNEMNFNMGISTSNEIFKKIKLFSEALANNTEEIENQSDLEKYWMF